MFCVPIWIVLTVFDCFDSFEIGCSGCLDRFDCFESFKMDCFGGLDSYEGFIFRSSDSFDSLTVLRFVSLVFGQI